MIDFVSFLLQNRQPFTTYQPHSLSSYVGVAKTVPIPRYDAPAVVAAQASSIELHVMPMIACSPSIFRAVLISIY